MAKVLILYYSSYGHIEAMAKAVADGVTAGGAQVVVKRVPETAPEGVARAANFKLEQDAPIASVPELENYDAIIVGAPTRYGRMPSQMAAFLDQTGGLWAHGALEGEGWGGLHIYRDSAWRTGDDVILNYRQSAALWHDRCWLALQPQGHDGG